MTRNLRSLGLAAFFILGACATTDKPAAPAAPAAPPAAVPGSAAFKQSDFAWSEATGTGEIRGQVTYSAHRTPYGCTGVVLTPETPWVRQRMSILYRSTESAALPAEEVRSRTPPERSQDYSKYVKRTACSADGKFTFSGLPDGAWFVITVVKPTNGAAGAEMAIMRRVSIKGGKPVTVRL